MHNSVLLNSYLDLTLSTDRLDIRSWRVEDAPQAYEMYGDPEVARYLTGIPEESVDTQRTNIAKLIAAYSQLDLGMGSFPLIEKFSGNLVGAVLLKPLPRSEELEAWRDFRDDPTAIPQVHEIEIGWHLARQYWGFGYATEAARRLMQYGFEDLKLDEIHAVLYKENTKSWMIAERLEMKHLGSTDRFYGKSVEHFVKP